MATIGTTTNQFGLGATNSRNGVYSAISGTGTWYAIYDDGTNLVVRTSTDGSTWSSATTIAGGGIGPNAAGGLDALADSSGNLHVGFGWNNSTGNAIYQKSTDGSTWFATAIAVNTGFLAGTIMLYESGGHVYARYMAVVSGQEGLYHATDPTSASSFALDYQVADSGTGGRNFKDRASKVLEVVGSNDVFVAVALPTTPSLEWFGTSASTFPGSTDFSQVSTSLLTNANLQLDLASTVDGGGTLHVLYHVSGTGWLEATYNGTTWTTGGALTQISDNDTSPAMVTDGNGTIHVFYNRYNAVNDYGVGHISKASGGSWTAQSDVVTHNGTNRMNLTVSHVPGNSKALLVWLEGTGSPWNVVGNLFSFSGGGSSLSKTLTDQFSGLDALVRSPTKNLSETQSALDLKTLTTGKNLSDSHSGTDTKTLQVLKALIEYHSGLDTLLPKSVTKTLTDAFSELDVLSKMPAKTFIERVSQLDSVTTQHFSGVLWTRTVTDAHSALDVVKRVFTKLNADAWSAIDTITRAWVAHLLIQEYVSLTDFVIKQYSRTQTDFTSETESHLLQTLKSVLDSVSSQDLLNRAMTKVLPDGTSGVDQPIKQVTHSVLDSFSETERVTIARGILLKVLDALSLTDAVVKLQDLRPGIRFALNVTTSLVASAFGITITMTTAGNLSITPSLLPAPLTTLPQLMAD